MTNLILGMLVFAVNIVVIVVVSIITTNIWISKYEVMRDKLDEDYVERMSEVTIDLIKEDRKNRNQIY